MFLIKGRNGNFMKTAPVGVGWQNWTAYEANAFRWATREEAQAALLVAYPVKKPGMRVQETRVPYQAP